MFEKKLLKVKTKNQDFGNSAYMMYKNIYEKKSEPELHVSSESYEEKKENEINMGKKPPKPPKPPANCWVVAIVSSIIVVIFIFLLIFSINILTVTK